MSRDQTAPMRIAISGKSGCGNSTVSRLVADHLGLKLVNYTFKNLAAEHGIGFAELHARAGRDFSIDRTLDRRQLAAAAGGNCVLASRLAIWLLADAELKVYLSAPPEVRARRIAQREESRFEVALVATGRRDASDRQRYLDLYRIDIDDAAPADLVVDTSAHNQFEAAAAIVDAARAVRAAAGGGI